MKSKCHFKILLEKIEYLENENKFLKEKLDEQIKDLNKEYIRGYVNGVKNAIKQIK